MTNSNLPAKHQETIEALWEKRDEISPNSPVKETGAIIMALEALDRGTYRVAERQEDGTWIVNQWLKKAVLLGFRIYDMEKHSGGPQGTDWWDKVPSKFQGWKKKDWKAAGFRAVPGSLVRRSAYIAKDVVLMPSFVNVGAYVDENSMVDAQATVGSCAQIGKNVHLSGGVGIGGVLEPLQAEPTIIEDDCFIGARSEVVEGVIIRRGAVLSMGVFIGKNTPIVDRTNDNKILRGEVPSMAVVMAGVHPENGLICPHIVKYRDEGTDASTALNDMLR
jgi:2,3,4,5-tetrahydropyridine-2-carboxylate N-succinyltransferase